MKKGASDLVIKLSKSLNVYSFNLITPKIQALELQSLVQTSNPAV